MAVSGACSVLNTNLHSDDLVLELVHVGLNSLHGWRRGYGAQRAGVFGWLKLSLPQIVWTSPVDFNARSSCRSVNATCVRPRLSAFGKRCSLRYNSSYVLRYDNDASSLVSMWVPLFLCHHCNDRHLGINSLAEH
jgi:hypothetical protein